MSYTQLDSGGQLADWAGGSDVHGLAKPTTTKGTKVDEGKS